MRFIFHVRIGLDQVCGFFWHKIYTSLQVNDIAGLQNISLCFIYAKQWRTMNFLIFVQVVHIHLIFTDNVPIRHIYGVYN